MWAHMRLFASVCLCLVQNSDQTIIHITESIVAGNVKLYQIFQNMGRGFKYASTCQVLVASLRVIGRCPHFNIKLHFFNFKSSTRGWFSSVISCVLCQIHSCQPYIVYSSRKEVQVFTFFSHVSGSVLLIISKKQVSSDRQLHSFNLLYSAHRRSRYPCITWRKKISIFFPNFDNKEKHHPQSLAPQLLANSRFPLNQMHKR